MQTSTLDREEMCSHNAKHSIHPGTLLLSGTHSRLGWEDYMLTFPPAADNKGGVFPVWKLPVFYGIGIAY